MLRMRELTADAATAMAQGRRSRQEDAVAADFSDGAEVGLAVLSDGMGGHSAGNLASRIIVAEIFSDLFYGAAEIDTLKQCPGDILAEAVRAANASVGANAQASPDREGMGGTAVAIVAMDDRLHWVSVGDSPLYLFRDGALRQLNEDHSLAPQIDMMVREGLLDADEGRDHPQRNCLTSALTGDEIQKIDCPGTPLDLASGDIVVLASDGLQSLSDDAIGEILNASENHGSRAMAQALLSAVDDLDQPDQDNTTVAVVRFQDIAEQHDLDRRPAPAPRTLEAVVTPLRQIRPVRRILAQIGRRSAL